MPIEASDGPPESMFMVASGPPSFFGASSEQPRRVKKKVKRAKERMVPNIARPP
jgi:hypothetical protein